MSAATFEVSEPSAGLAELRERFRFYLEMPDPTLVDFTAAVYVSVKLGTDPVWALIVAPPSSGKTETLQSLGELRGVHALSGLTPSTLISGLPPKQDKPNPSLLMRLPRRGGLLVLKDFGTILSMRDDDRGEILSQLREVYDGSFAKEFGNGLTITWDGRVGFVAGTTQAIDAHHAVINILGERFLYLRVPEPDRRTVAAMATMSSRGEQMRDDLRAAMQSFVDGLVASRAKVPDVSDPEHAQVREQLVSLADVVTWARTAVYRDRYTRDIEVAPMPEGPARFVKATGADRMSLRLIPRSATGSRRRARGSRARSPTVA